VGQFIETLCCLLNISHFPPGIQIAVQHQRVTGRNQVESAGIRIALLCLALIATAVVPETLWAATIPAASCSQSDVATAVASANDGDAVIIPPCTAGASWTTPLNITRAITLQGAGIAQTVLIDNVTKGTANCSGVSPMIIVNVSANLPWRISGMTIQGGATDPYVCNVGHMGVGGGSHAFRIDHIAFANMQTSGISTSGDLRGVIDHNTFTGSHKQGVIIRHNNWGGIGAYGDNSWAQPSSLGTQDAIFIEDNIFMDNLAQGAGAFDIFAGGRVVFRYNQASFIGSHGTESSGRFRSVRHYEVYNNTFTSQPGGTAFGFYVRGGTGVVFNNTWVCVNNDCVNNPYGNMIRLENDRDRDAFGVWYDGTSQGRACDGTGFFDKNDGAVYASGTHNGTNGANNLLTDTTKAWTANQWNTGYSVRNVTQGWSSTIDANTATTATSEASVYGTNHLWNSGDSYQILKAYPCIDQVGRGAGALLSGDSPSPVAWPSQILDPIYQWGNNFTGITSPLISTSTTHAQANRDWYDNTPKPGYIPFTYPHPLVGASTSSPPTAPTNLQVR